MIEVDRLPRVDQHRTRRLGVARARPQSGVILLGCGREPMITVDGDDRRRAVRVARRQRNLARVEQLAGLDHPSPVGQPLGEHRVVAAPCDMNAPHRARPLVESGGAGEQQRRVLVRRAPPAVLAGERAVLPRHPHRVELARPAAGERAQLVGVLGHGQRHRQAAQQVRPVPVVRELGRDGECPVELERHVEQETGDLVDGTNGERAAVVRVRSGEKRGDQSRPVGWKPSRPGRPGYPSRAPGTTETGATTSGAPRTSGRDSWWRFELDAGGQRCAPVHDRRRAGRHVDDDVARPAAEVQHVSPCWRRA